MLFIQLLRKVIIMPTKIDFIGGNTKRCLMAMALPMIAAMFLNMMYNLVDSLWIGNLLGENGLCRFDKLHSYHSDLNLCCDGGRLMVCRS